PDAWEAVRAYAWPGNLRELLAVLSAARARAKSDRITAADLPASLRLSLRLDQTPGRPPERPLSLETLLADVERRLIRLALGRAGGRRVASRRREKPVGAARTAPARFVSAPPSPRRAGRAGYQGRPRPRARAGTARTRGPPVPRGGDRPRRRRGPPRARRPGVG